MKSDNEELERCNDEPVEEQVPGLVCDMTRGCRYANGVHTYMTSLRA